MSASLRSALPSDAATLRALAEANPPLDVHTDYTYWVMCHSGASLSFVAERDGRAVGFVATVPTAAGAALIWQVCVDAHVRGVGLGRRLVSAARDAAVAQGFARIEFTIAADNAASRALFASVFGELQAHGTAGPASAPEELFVVDLA